uniref:non-specific serine/threonine protein kinase n=1 Tax=Chrysotila carterae TaxID=13221 RepID=A0A7S4AZT8_CHRCT|mmetsp:Transcript_57873/g.125651  ORF Transcript_57873/g.125651 Transcript_57873/m.125651 type:complete len:434 (-) Transcript_57873:116-1417(-)
MVKKVGKYEIGRTLGEGTFGKVKFAVNTETNERVAIKILDKEKIQKQNMGEQIKKEIAVMKMVKQRHVVNLLEVLASRTKIFIVLELVTGGELFDKIVTAGRFDEPTARKYFRQLVSGVEYCHRQGVCHRDLKPENLLLDEQAMLKISDFGLSALYGSDHNSTLLHTTCGTPNYVAPEVLADKGYDGFMADVWSCGVILYVLLAGFLPFDEPSMSALFRKIIKAEFSYPSWFSPGVKDILNKILVPSPEKRYTMAQIKESDWFLEGGYTEEDESEVLLGTGGDDETGPDIMDSVEEEEIKQEGGKAFNPATMNAFELITMCGGLDLTPMVDQQSTSIKRFTRFNSQVPPAMILAKVREVLTAEGIEHKVSERNFKVKVTHTSERGQLTCTVQIFSIAPGLSLVDWRRGQGDVMAYLKFFQEIKPKLADLIAPS